MDIGSDGLERELKTLKRQMAQKGGFKKVDERETRSFKLTFFLPSLPFLPPFPSDIQVESYQNEIYKLTAAFEEIKKARDEALYRVSSSSREGGKEVLLFERSVSLDESCLGRGGRREFKAHML